MKVNYEEARDNQQLAEIVQSTRQQHQELQPAKTLAREDLELQLPNPSLSPVSDQRVPERKKQPVWEPQYGIPAVQDLIRAIPENLSQPQAETPELAHRQREKAQAAYQQWAIQARAIYQVEEPQDIDQRITFLMQEQQQSPNQITQFLTQSPAVQELIKRDRSYAQSYSKFCQSQANANQATWLFELDKYRRAVEIERQQQEQQRRALESQQQQQQERQHNLKLLGHWQEAALTLGRSAFLCGTDSRGYGFLPAWSTAIREDYCSKATGLSCLPVPDATKLGRVGVHKALYTAQK